MTNPCFSNLRAGDTLALKNGMTGIFLRGRATVLRISKTGARIMVSRSRSNGTTYEQAFYRTGGVNGHSWVAEPGSGTGGSVLNDRFDLRRS